MALSVIICSMFLLVLEGMASSLTQWGVISTCGSQHFPCCLAYGVDTRNIIVHFYCDDEPLLRLAWGNTVLTETLGFMVSILIKQCDVFHGCF